ncbi:uncharacterized protein LOC135471552 isoform X2 [Liolophura sinensis]
MTLPCAKETAYPDPYSCQHFYFCDKNGEIRRYTCGANYWVRIAKGAALCDLQKLSTCDVTRPHRQCDNVKGYLPNEYCEVLAPGRTTWTYPDPEGCLGYYKYSPPDLTRIYNDLVVERLSCPRGTYYSPSGEKCAPVTGNPDNLCGGKWIYQSEDCRMIKLNPNTVHTSRGEDGPLIQNKSDINGRTSKIPQTTVAVGNASIPSAPPPLGSYNGLSILAWIVGLAAALVLLVTVVTVILFMLQKRRRKRRIQNGSFNLPESSAAHGMDISRPISFTELNEYAAIDDVFGNTLETRPMHTGGCMADLHVINRIDGDATASGRAVPDGYGSSGAPSLPPRPKSTPSYTNPERKDLKSHKSVGCCANEPFSDDILCKPNENPKSFCNVNWQTALNASMPDESNSSDEYEAISFTPLMTPEPPPDDSVKVIDTDCDEKIDNQEYMIPVISHANVEVQRNDSFTKSCILTTPRRTQSLPHKLSRRIPPVNSNDHTIGLVSNVAFPDTSKNEAVGDVDSNSNNTDSINSSITRDEMHQVEEEPKENNGQSHNQDNDTYAWNISDSWIRCDKKQKNGVCGTANCDLDASPETECLFLPEEPMDVDEKDSTCNDAVDNTINTHEIFNNVCISPACAPVVHLEANVTDNDGTATNIESTSVENTKPLNECEESCSTQENEGGAEFQSDGVSKNHPMGYEILVSASSPNDFRVYQYISADSETSSSSVSDLESIPDIKLSVVAGQGSTKYHEYYVLDKHHSSDTSVELQCDGQTKNLTLFEPNQRQSCNF